MDSHLPAYVAAAALILIGVIGTALLMPGVPLVFAGMFLAAWVDDFRVIPIWMVVLLAVLALLALAVDVMAGLLGAKRVGASRLAIAGSVVGTLVGLLFGIPGVLVGPFLGAIAGELLHSRDPRHATRVGFGTWTGMVVGMAFKMALVFVMLGAFAAVILVR